MCKTVLSFILFFLSASGLAQTAHGRNAQGDADYKRSLEIRRQNEDRRNAERLREQELRNANYWGAFAYLANANWRFFYAGNRESESVAKRAAIEACREKTGRDDCEVVMTFKNSCASITVDNLHYYTATGSSVKKAERDAMEACKKTGSALCSVGFKGDCSDYYSAYNKSRPWF